MKPCSMLSSDASQLCHNIKHHCHYIRYHCRDEKNYYKQFYYLAGLAENCFYNTNVETITYKDRDLLWGTNDTYSWLGSKNGELITMIDRLELS